MLDKLIDLDFAKIQIDYIKVSLRITKDLEINTRQDVDKNKYSFRRLKRFRLMTGVDLLIEEWCFANKIRTVRQMSIKDEIFAKCNFWAQIKRHDSIEDIKLCLLKTMLHLHKFLAGVR